MTSDGVVYIVDDDLELADSLARLLQRNSLRAEAYASSAALTANYRALGSVCIVSDVMLGETHGFQAAAELRALDPACAIVFMTAWPSTSDAVDAIRRHGGVDYLEKPPDVSRLLSSIREGLQWSAFRRRCEERLAALSPRERQVLELLVEGKSSKVIAAELHVSPKTIEDHRAAIRAKTGASSLQELLALLR